MTVDVKEYIRTIADFPKEGIMFRDVTTLFGDPRGFRAAIDQMLHPWAGQSIEKVAGLEARGFILGGAVAHQLSIGFVPVDAVQPGEKVLVVDDLIATGGTAIAGVKLLERLGAQIAGCAFLVDLPDLGGTAKLRAMGIAVNSLCAFEGD
jgi:adenine phosphoribosyltransferase